MFPTADLIAQTQEVLHMANYGPDDPTGNKDITIQNMPKNNHSSNPFSQIWLLDRFQCKSMGLFHGLSATSPKSHVLEM